MDSALIRELMVVNDISSSDNDVIGDDDSDIVLDDIVIKKVRNLSSWFLENHSTLLIFPI